MKISDEQLDKMILRARRHVENAKSAVGTIDDVTLNGFNTNWLNESSAMLHILKTYKSLDKTKDGVRMKPGDTVYRITMMNRIIHDYVASGTVDDWSVQSCYSTHEAAEEAMKASKK